MGWWLLGAALAGIAATRPGTVVAGPLREKCREGAPAGSLSGGWEVEGGPRKLGTEQGCYRDNEGQRTRLALRGRDSGGTGAGLASLVSGSQCMWRDQELGAGAGEAGEGAEPHWPRPVSALSARDPFFGAVRSVIAPLPQARRGSEPSARKPQTRASAWFPRCLASWLNRKPRPCPQTALRGLCPARGPLLSQRFI